MSYDMNRLRWVLTRRYYNLLQRLDARKLGTTAPAKEIIDALVNRVLAEGLACHYCGIPLNLYAHAYDFRTALSRSQGAAEREAGQLGGQPHHLLRQMQLRKSQDKLRRVQGDVTENESRGQK